MAGGVVGVVTIKISIIYISYTYIIYHYISCNVVSPGVVCGVGGVHGAVAPARVHLELPVLALLGDGVHLREEYRADEDPACTTITVKASQYNIYNTSIYNIYKSGQPS